MSTQKALCEIFDYGVDDKKVFTVISETENETRIVTFHGSVLKAQEIQNSLTKDIRYSKESDSEETEARLKELIDQDPDVAAKIIEDWIMNMSTGATNSSPDEDYIDALIEAGIPRLEDEWVNKHGYYHGLQRQWNDCGELVELTWCENGTVIGTFESADDFKSFFIGRAAEDLKLGPFDITIQPTL